MSPFCLLCVCTGRTATVLFVCLFLLWKKISPLLVAVFIPSPWLLFLFLSVALLYLHVAEGLWHLLNADKSVCTCNPVVWSLALSFARSMMLFISDRCRKHYLHLFVDIVCACALFVHRAAGVPVQAHQLLCADGECCSHSDAGPWCPASADPTRPAYTGRKIFFFSKYREN